MIRNLIVHIADLIEGHLDAPEMASGSLHATLRFGEELEKALAGTSLDGKKIRERFIPFRHGIEPDHERTLRRLAKLLRADTTYALAVMFLSGSSNTAICQAAASIPGCSVSYILREEFISEDIGL